MGVSFPECSISIVAEAELPRWIAESGADFLFLGLPGRKVFHICNTLHEFPSSIALMTIATGFPGLQYYMRFTGLFWRSFVDQLLFTDPHLYRLARNWLSLLPLSTANCVLLGSPRLKKCRHAATSASENISPSLNRTKFRHRATADMSWRDNLQFWPTCIRTGSF